MPTTPEAQGGGGKSGKSATGRKTRKPKPQVPPVEPAVITSYKDIADRFVSSKPLPAEQLRGIILANLITSGAELRKAVTVQVDGYEDDAALRSALEQHERAERLFQSSAGA